MAEIASIACGTGGAIRTHARILVVTLKDADGFSRVPPVALVQRNVISVRAHRILRALLARHLIIL